MKLLISFFATWLGIALFVAVIVGICYIPGYIFGCVGCMGAFCCAWSVVHELLEWKKLK